MEVDWVMNFILMTSKKGHECVPPVRQSSRRAGGAFDVWLTRGLHQLFDDVANEPIPDDLLRLIEDDREQDK